LAEYYRLINFSARQKKRHGTLSACIRKSESESAVKEIREADWKVLRKLRPILLYRYCQKVLREINRIGAEENKSDHDRYLAVYQEVQKHDREIGLLFNNPRRLSALMQLMAINDRDLFTEEELSLFSTDIHEMLNRFSSGRII